MYTGKMRVKSVKEKEMRHKGKCRAKQRIQRKDCSITVVQENSPLNPL